MHFAKQHPFIAMYEYKNATLKAISTEILMDVDNFEFDESQDLNLGYLDQEENEDYFYVILEKGMRIYSIHHDHFQWKINIKYPGSQGLLGTKIYHTMMLTASKEGIFYCKEVTEFAKIKKTHVKKFDFK